MYLIINTNDIQCIIYYYVYLIIIVQYNYFYTFFLENVIIHINRIALVICYDSQSFIPGFIDSYRRFDS